jgi:hypothetical protein
MHSPLGVHIGAVVIVLTASCTAPEGPPLREADPHPAVDPGEAPIGGDASVGAQPTSGGGTMCGADMAWTCSQPTSRTRCKGGVTESEPCSHLCVSRAIGGASCAEPAPSWDCADSIYKGDQWWTCNAGAIYRCNAGTPLTVKCEDGCAVGPPGTHDTCAAPPSTGAPPATSIPVPTFTITISGGLFAESAVRKPLEDGLKYAIDRIAKHVVVGSKTAPPFTINFLPSTDSYASGLANVSYTNVWVPPGYPLTGDSQNHVVNISIHEIGHILAHHLIAPRELRDTCVNEGLASWIAGKYWMKAGGKPVASLKAAARYDIDRGAAYASMTTCQSASDAWYKVYASYFEYLELNKPGAILAVSSAKTSKTAYTSGWQAWLQP